MRWDDLDVGAELAQLEAEGGLDQGAGVPGQHFLGDGNGELGAGAQADGDGAGGPAEFLRHEDAVGGDHLAAGLGVLPEFLDADAVNIADDEVVKAHALGPVLLAQVDLPENGAEGVHQLAVGLEVDAQVRPHLLVFS